MDQILYWNAVALESDRKAHTEIDPAEPGPRGPIGRSRALAIVHLAMHDAIFSIFGAPHGTWLTAPPVAATGALPDAAIAVAAHTTLSALYPAQTTRLDKALRTAGPRGRGTVRGGNQGQAVAHAILKDRAGDPGCIAVTSRYIADPPPQAGDPRSLSRARDGSGRLGSPPLYNLITREFAVAQRNDVEQNARLFALVNTALADAAILCRDDPSHPSVHAAFGGAAFQTIRRYYEVAADGPDTLTDGLGFVSGELDGTATDGHGRVDLSQHIGGVRLGRDVADDLWAAGLRQDQAAGPRLP
ncbi:hypothetical protein ACFXO9_10265 [Nocardia tengchongensis]|uniref:hypothetical protein n=1 Tax=Nocardia tengchongensis TaxID=2055889 RepID=UPI0036AA5658